MIMRARKDGGISICRSPEHLIGKARCNHIGDAIRVTKTKKTYFVELSKLPEIKIERMSFDLSNEKKSKIISILRRQS